MAGFVLHAGATVLCAHGGHAEPTEPTNRVTVGGQPVATVAGPWVVAGCPVLPACVSATWLTAATRVLVDGHPVLVTGGQAVSAPSGAPVVVAATQARVTAT